MIRVDRACACWVGHGFPEVPHHALVVEPIQAVLASDWMGGCAPCLIYSLMDLGFFYLHFIIKK